MGAVSIDIHKSEREFKHLTLSDRNVVKYLILHRSKVDASYGVSANVNISHAGDIFDFNQELICLYASLDVLLKKMELKEKEYMLLDLIFEGNTVMDVVELKYYPKKTAYRMINRIIDKVVENNNHDWNNTINKNICKY